jgi:hypothetical protein
VRRDNPEFGQLFVSPALCLGKLIEREQMQSCDPVLRRREVGSEPSE